MKSRPAAELGAAWGAFARTLLHFDSAPPRTVDLRERVSLATRRFFVEAGLERPFGVVTAQNPMGEPQSASGNARLAATLQDELAGSACAYVPVNACSPDASHCEKSVAVALGMRSVIELADRYRQLAVFWFDGDAFWIIPVRSDLPKVRLPTRA